MEVAVVALNCEESYDFRALDRHPQRQRVLEVVAAEVTQHCRGNSRKRDASKPKTLQAVAFSSA